MMKIRILLIMMKPISLKWTVLKILSLTVMKLRTLPLTVPRVKSVTHFQTYIDESDEEEHFINAVDNDQNHNWNMV